MRRPPGIAVGTELSDDMKFHPSKPLPGGIVMPRYASPSPKRRSAPHSVTVGILRHAWALLWPRVVASARICWTRCVKLLDGDWPRGAASTLHNWIISAIRWARENDTVSEGAARDAIIRHEERTAQAENRKAAAEHKRRERNEKRREREKRYAEKSSIYLG